MSTDTPGIRRAVAGVGSLYYGTAAAERRYLGSCASILNAGIFVTAAHCLDDVDPKYLWINHFGGPPPDCFTRVRQVHRIPKGDIAVIETDAPEGKWAQPFQGVQYAADFGEEVYAIGYPEDLISATTPGRATLRFFRGIVQRPFHYGLPGHTPYSAFELSFPCPPGLSGGPVVLAQHPRIILGIVTANFESYTVVHTEETEIEAGRPRAVQSRNVVTYGVAANIIYAADRLEALLGRSLPNPLAKGLHE